MIDVFMIIILIIMIMIIILILLFERKPDFKKVVQALWRFEGKTWYWKGFFYTEGARVMIGRMVTFFGHEETSWSHNQSGEFQVRWPSHNNWVVRRNNAKGPLFFFVRWRFEKKFLLFFFENISANVRILWNFQLFHIHNFWTFQMVRQNVDFWCKFLVSDQTADPTPQRYGLGLPPTQ